MKTCPKCHYHRQTSDNHVHAEICPACGIAYQKWIDRQQANTLPENTDAELIANECEDQYPTSLQAQLWAQFTAVPARVDSATLWGRGATWLALALWAAYFTLHGIDWEIIGGSFLHNINLAFHEFGHVFFAPFGEFMMILGGSLFQVAMPLGLMLAFSLYQGDNFGASVMLWWCGQSFVDIAPYIRDAEYRALPLVGGGSEDSHDWGNLLTMLDAVDSCYALAHTSFVTGVLLMLAGLGWGAWQLKEQHALLQPSS
jgi:hypothetical protein